MREGNIIYLKDATKAQMTSVFGSKEDHLGRLFNWTKPTYEGSMSTMQDMVHLPETGEAPIWFPPYRQSDRTTNRIPPEATLQKPCQLPTISITVIL